MLSLTFCCYWTKIKFFIKDFFINATKFAVFSTDGVERTKERRAVQLILHFAFYYIEYLL